MEQRQLVLIIVTPSLLLYLCAVNCVQSPRLPLGDPPRRGENLRFFKVPIKRKTEWDRLKNLFTVFKKGGGMVRPMFYSEPAFITEKQSAL